LDEHAKTTPDCTFPLVEAYGEAGLAGHVGRKFPKTEETTHKTEQMFPDSEQKFPASE
jgi:hypothetical protein